MAVSSEFSSYGVLGKTMSFKILSYRDKFTRSNPSLRINKQLWLVEEGKMFFFCGVAIEKMPGSEKNPHQVHWEREQQARHESRRGTNSEEEEKFKYSGQSAGGGRILHIT